MNIVFNPQNLLHTYVLVACVGVKLASPRGCAGGGGHLGAVTAGRGFFCRRGCPQPSLPRHGKSHPCCHGHVTEHVCLIKFINRRHTGFRSPATDVAAAAGQGGNAPCLPRSWEALRGDALVTCEVPAPDSRAGGGWGTGALPSLFSGTTARKIFYKHVSPSKE